MRGVVKCLVALAVINGATWVYSQGISSSQAPAGQTLGEKPRWKAENGLLISWVLRSKDATTSQVEVFDESGHSLAKVKILAAVEEATSSAIYDVSARRDQAIAVAAVFARRPGERPAAALLLFDFNGRPLSAFALAPAREIFRLELDERSNIWTIGSGAGDQNPSQVPMVVEYDAKGNAIRELLTRSMFPLHAEIMNQNSKIGPVSSGYGSGVFWFWLPESTEMVTVATDNSGVSVKKTGLPNPSVVPMWMVRDATGNLVAELHHHNGQASEKTYAVWSPATGSWASFNADACEPDRLVGVDQDKLVYVHRGGPDVCTGAAPLATH